MSAQTTRTLWRQTILLLALIASIAASLWTYRNEQQDVLEENVSQARPIGNKGAVVTGTNPEVLAASARAAINDAVHSIDQVEAKVAAASDHTDRNAAKVLLDPFAPLTVAPPPPPKPAPFAVFVAPTAPAIPFQYMGRLEQVQKALPGKSDSKNTQGVAGTPHTVVYLARGDESFSVSAGENIDANYRFVGIEGDTLVFMYLPLSQRQTLPIGP